MNDLSSEIRTMRDAMKQDVRLHVGTDQLAEWEGAARMMEDALSSIDGPADSALYVGVYREAGGGYEGLQAIARAGLLMATGFVGPNERSRE